MPCKKPALQARKSKPLFLIVTPRAGFRPGAFCLGISNLLTASRRPAKTKLIIPAALGETGLKPNTYITP